MYKEIFKLKEMLEKEGIPFEFIKSKIHNGYHLNYPKAGEQDVERICSVVEHDFSYGHEDDLLEIMGLLTDEEERKDGGGKYCVAGYLTAKDVFNRIKKDYERM